MSGAHPSLRKAKKCRRELTPEQRRAAELLEEGYEVADVAARFGVSRSAVHAWRRTLDAERAK